MLSRLLHQFSFWVSRRNFFQRLQLSGIRALALLFVMSLGLSLAVAACTPSQSSNLKAVSSLDPQQPKLTVLKMGHQKGMALLEVLKARGSLEKRLQPLGIAVQWLEFSSTPPLLEGMATGNIVFGGGGGTGSVFAQASDKPFVRVAAGTGSTRGQAILTLEDSPIKSLADLKGKKVAVTKGTSQHYIIVRALEKVGLKFSDIKPIYLSPAEALPAFERGDIDAWVIWDPYTAGAERKLHTRLLADNSDIFGNKAPTESPSFYYASPDFARDHPDIVKVIVEELGKAGAWSTHNPDASAKLLSSLYKIDLPTMEVVERRGGDRRILPVNDEVLSSLQRMADTFSELKVIPKQVNVKDPKYNWVADRQNSP